MFLWIENSFFNHLMHLPIFTDTNINNGISVEIFSDRNIPTCRTKKKYTGISCYSIDQASQEPCHAILYYSRASVPSDSHPGNTGICLEYLFSGGP